MKESVRARWARKRTPLWLSSDTLLTLAHLLELSFHYCGHHNFTFSCNFLFQDRLINRLQTIKRLWKKKARDVSYVPPDLCVHTFSFISFGIMIEDQSLGTVWFQRYEMKRKRYAQIQWCPQTKEKKNEKRMRAIDRRSEGNVCSHLFFFFLLLLIRASFFSCVYWWPLKLEQKEKLKQSSSRGHQTQEKDHVSISFSFFISFTTYSFSLNWLRPMVVKEEERERS